MARLSQAIFRVVLGFSLTVAAGSAWAEGKFGYVSLDRLLREAVPAKAASTRLEADFKKRDQEVQEIAAKVRALSEKLDKEGAVMSESNRIKLSRELADLDRDFQRKRREMQEDFNQRRNEEMSNVIDKANRAIKQIAEAEKYDLIFQEAVYISPSVDITDKVLKVLNSAK